MANRTPAASRQTKKHCDKRMANKKPSAMRQAKTFTKRYN
jgi:hypothetical protein